jgi:hypothetical protein
VVRSQESETDRQDREAHIRGCRLCQELAALVIAQEAGDADAGAARGQLPLKLEAGGAC